MWMNFAYYDNCGNFKQRSAFVIES